MENQSLTEIIQESLAADPEITDNPEIEAEDTVDTESLVDELINGVGDDVDEDGEAEDEESEDKGDEDPDLGKFQVKVDGEIIEVTIDELKSGYQRQADYTRKAQQLAAEKSEFEATVEGFSETLSSLESLDSAWEENPVQVLAHFTANTENPTHAVALLLKELAVANLLDRDFMETFGITSDVQQEWAKESEVQTLRRRATSNESAQSKKLQEAEYEAEVAKAVAEYDRQIDDILDNEGLELTVKQRNAFRTRLAGYAHENDLTNLKAAYKALKYEESQKKQKLAKQSMERAKQKKAASVVGRSSGGAAGSTAVEDNSDLSAVIRAAMNEASQGR
jgi:hypothetical protein